MSGFGTVFGGFFSNLSKKKQEQVPVPVESAKPVESPKPSLPSQKLDLLLSLIQEAKKWVGVYEHGSNKGPEVQKMQKTVSGSHRNGNGSAESESWCMSGVQTWIWEVEKAFGVKSPLAASEHCLTVYRDSPKSLRSDLPFPGAVVIWRHGSTDAGHTGIVTKVIDHDSFQTIECNTGPSTTEVQRNGDGIYAKTRAMKGSGDMRVVGFLRPFV